ncbi:hypothetical protein C8R47DRAFT_1106828 [Mycena vitilis]|nr:hypothetical protein C8R47DRAFT_1106828 [Mycena vitilis]
MEMPSLKAIKARVQKARVQTDDRNRPVEAKEQGVQERFEDAVASRFKYDGIFVSTPRTYNNSTVPNPCLELEGLGLVGLPLSTRDGAAIIAACAAEDLPENGSGSEFSAAKVRFNNKEWKKWIETTAGEAALQDLTETSSNVYPSYEFKRLTIQDMAHTRTLPKNQECEGKLADLIIVLPSLFEGGEVELPHCFATRTISLKPGNDLCTAVLALKSGVDHTISPVLSGYRLALEYVIFRPSADPGREPIKVDIPRDIRILCAIFISWKQDKYKRPPFLAAAMPPFLAAVMPPPRASARKRSRGVKPSLSSGRLLAQQNCVCSGFEPNSFVGSNALLMYCLEPLATKYCFDIAFVKHWKCPYRPMEIVDITGMPIEMDSLRSQLPPSIWKSSQHTVLVLYHRRSALQATVRVGDMTAYVCRILNKSTSASPTAQELTLVEKFVASCETPRKDKDLTQAVGVFKTSAVRWNDPALLVRVLTAAAVDKKIQILGIDGFLLCYTEFEWEDIQTFFETTIRNGESNSDRRTLLEELARVASVNGDMQLSAWCVGQQEVILRFLCDLNAGDIPWLLKRAVPRGDAFLRDTVFPQLLDLKLSWVFWLDFLRKLETEIDISSDTAKALIPDCIRKIVNVIPPFPTHDCWGENEKIKRAPEHTLEIIKLCIDYEMTAACLTLFNRMRNSARIDTFSSECAPGRYYADLSTSLVDYMQGAPSSARLPVRFKLFFNDAMAAMLFPARSLGDELWGADSSSVDSDSDSDSHAMVDDDSDSNNRDSQVVKQMLEIIQFGGGLSPVRQRLDSATLPNLPSHALIALIKSISSRFAPKKVKREDDRQGVAADPVAREDYDTVISGFVQALINTLKINTPKHLLEVVALCYEVDAMKHLPRLLTRALVLPSNTSMRSHLEKILVPFTLTLAPYLAENGVNLGAPPFDFFPAGVVKHFAQHVMPQIHPLTQLAGKINCRCDSCSELQEFVLDETEDVVLFKEPERMRTHIQSQIPTASLTLVRCTIRKEGSPHTLQIAKVDIESTPSGLREKNTETGMELLAVLGDVAAQRRILGNDYDFIFEEINREFV